MSAHLPAPTAWPAALATGVTFFALGLVTNVVVLAFGAVVFVVSLVGWVRLLLLEGHEP